MLLAWVCLLGARNQQRGGDAKDRARYRHNRKAEAGEVKVVQGQQKLSKEHGRQQAFMYLYPGCFHIPTVIPSPFLFLSFTRRAGYSLRRREAGEAVERGARFGWPHLRRR